MPRPICSTCGTQFAEQENPPTQCPICVDDRQYVGWGGQCWTSSEELAQQYSPRLEQDSGLLAIGMQPAFAIDQRSFLLPTDAGNILWECVSLVTDEAVAAINERGGLDRIVVSHPHFYSSMADWSDAFGGVPILLHESNRQWVQRSHPHIEYWSGDSLSLSKDVTLIRAGGHFHGSTVLHWKRGPRPGGALFSGDAPQVVRDRRHVSFMYSYPNLIPMRTSDVLALRERLAPFQYEDVFGYTWGLNICGAASEAVEASFERYLDYVRH